MESHFLPPTRFKLMKQCQHRKIGNPMIQPREQIFPFSMLRVHGGDSYNLPSHVARVARLAVHGWNVMLDLSKSWSQGFVRQYPKLWPHVRRICSLFSSRLETNGLIGELEFQWWWAAHPKGNSHLNRHLLSSYHNLD